jgi:hypothetical protein
MGTERATGTGYKVSVVTGALLLALCGVVHAQDGAGRTPGRGFVLGGGLGVGRLTFPGPGHAALAVSGVTGSLTIAGETMDTRGGDLIDASRADAAGAAHVALLPASDVSAGLSFHVGYAFSHRVALLVSAELVAGVESGFSTAMGGVVLRYWPTSRLWIEAGPASGDLRYGYDATVVEDFAGTGYGMRTGVGLTVLQRPRWGLDLEARFGTLSFDGVRATSVSVGLSAISRRR